MTSSNYSWDPCSSDDADFSPYISRPPARADFRDSFASNIRSATHQDLMRAGNCAYMDLNSAYIQVKAELKSAQSEITHLRKLTDTLVTKQIPTIAPSQSGPAYSKTAISLPLQVPNDSPLSQQQDQDDYPNVPYWNYEDWVRYKEKCKKRGCAYDKLGFLTDEEGDTIPKARLKQMTETARDIWNELRHHSMDPASWKKKTTQARQFFYHNMVREYSEFMLGSGFWKLETFATLRYPDWCTSYRNESSAKRTIKEEADDLETTMIRKRKKQRYLPPSDTSIITIDDDEPVSSSTSAKGLLVSSSDLTTPYNPTSNPAIPGNNGADISKDSEHATAAPTNPSLLISSPEVENNILNQDLPQIAAASIVAPTTNPAPILACQGPPINPVNRTIKVTDKTKSNIPGNRLSHTVLPPKNRRTLNPLQNLEIPPPSIIVAETQSPESAGPRKINKKLLKAKEGVTTARNLFLIDYIKTHPDSTEAEFNAIWKGLDNSTKQKYDATSKAQTKERKKGSATKTAPIDKPTHAETT